MVFVPINHSYNSIQHGSSPNWFICRMPYIGGKMKTMCFNIGLIDHVHAEQIAQLVPPWMLRVMAVSDGIHIVLLHHNQILDEYNKKKHVSEHCTRSTNMQEDIDTHKIHYLNHAGLQVCFTETRVVFMPVHPSYLHRLSIYKELFWGF